MPKVNHKKKTIIPYNYSIVFSSLASNTTATGTISIEADADFITRKAVYFADILLAAQTDSSRVLPLCTFQITDTGTGRNLSNIQIPITSFFGTAENPFILPVPRKYRANSVLNFTVTNIDAASTYNLRLTLIGEKVMVS